MPDNSVPTLLQALSETIELALKLTADKWIRVEVPRDWPMRDVIQQIKPKFPGLRLGVLKPFSLTELMPDCPRSVLRRKSLVGVINQLKQDTRVPQLF